MRVLFLLSFLLLGCSLQEDFNYASQSDLITVNGFLHPDSTVTIKVTNTAPYPNGDSFSPIVNANVKLYENDSQVGELTYSTEKQAYFLNYYPKERHSYRIEVYINEYHTLTATTYIPQRSIIEACYTPFPYSEIIRLNGRVKIDTHIKRVDPASVHWIGLSSKQFKVVTTNTFPYRRTDSSATEVKPVVWIYSTSSSIDSFNGTRDEGINSYRRYLRLNPGRDLDEYQVDAFSIGSGSSYGAEQLQKLSDSLGLYVHVYTVSEEYDRYWKNAMINYLNSNLEAGTPNPFAEQVVNYSNVTGGTGVFAGYNSQTVGVHKIKCQ